MIPSIQEEWKDKMCQPAGNMADMKADGTE